MGYGAYLTGLLSPLGVYDLQPESRSGACVAALGGQMDAVTQELAEGLRESSVITAQDEGLAVWEKALGGPLQEQTAARRAAIRVRMYQDAVACSAACIEAVLAACGVQATLSMDDDGVTAVVRCAAVPAQGSAERALVESLLPAHLAVRYEAQ